MFLPGLDRRNYDALHTLIPGRLVHNGRLIQNRVTFENLIYNASYRTYTLKGPYSGEYADTIFSLAPPFGAGKKFGYTRFLYDPSLLPFEVT